MSRLRYLSNARTGSDGTVCEGNFLINGNIEVTGSYTYGSGSLPLSQSLLGTLTVGIDTDGYDVKFYGKTTSKYWLWDESADGVVLAGTFGQTGAMTITGTLDVSSNSTIGGTLGITGATSFAATTTFNAGINVGSDGTGHDVTFYTASASSKVMIDEGSDELLITAVDTTMTGKLTVGANTAGLDVKFFGATNLKYWEWDEGANQMNVAGTASIVGATAITGAVTITGALTATGIVTSSLITDASAVGTAGVVIVGGLGVAKKMYLGTDLVMVAGDIDFSTATTGTYNITLKDNQADALSINRASTAMMVFTSTTALPTVTITPSTVITGNVVSAARFYEKITVTSLTTAATATYTAAQLVGGYISDAITGASTCTTATATEIIAAIPNCQTGSSFEFTVENAASSAIAITIGDGTGITLTGTMTIGQNNSKRFLCVVTDASAKTATIYSLGTVVT